MSHSFPSDTADAPDLETFDATFIETAMRMAASDGWARLSLVDVALEVGAPVDAVRSRFPFKYTILLRIGQMADESAMRDDGMGATLRERLFDLLMRRLDVFQQYREGLRAALHALPYDPALAALLGATTLDTMRWIADLAGIDLSGFGGALRVQAVTGIWTYTLRAWEQDDSPDLATTMATLDKALDRAERFGMLKPSTTRLTGENDHGSLPDFSQDHAADIVL
ncbi:TetR family transcriptional regulator [Brytella acorum]|uniref:TetR family transcriptional regulator n=1 Tax=Brytella acorum TaxID=2959299 RepID=A0AA35UI46_9PROT|nr:TetR family transcriptional regulator [Brytella acorum]MDF3625920.1 TetR family transcriptional regulator [Brytella acorum]CAI9121857.1 TetR family transcriptional regulator [Brytella acorum]